MNAPAPDTREPERVAAHSLKYDAAGLLARLDAIASEGEDREEHEREVWLANVAIQCAQTIRAQAEKIADLQRIADGVVRLKELHATEGAMELTLQQSPEIAQWVAQCFAAIVQKAENYVEMKFDVPHTDDWITVLVKKGAGKTPHQLRAEADATLARVNALEKELGKRYSYESKIFQQHRRSFANQLRQALAAPEKGRT